MCLLGQGSLNEDHESRIVFSLVVPLFLIQAACTPGDKLHFETFEDLQRSDVYASWLPDFVPNGSKDIEVWYEVESGLVRASFSFDGERPVLIKGMQQLAASSASIAKSSYPEIVNLKMTVFYSCDFKEIGTIEKPLRYPEARFVGDTGERVFYWNSLSKDLFRRVCEPG